MLHSTLPRAFLAPGLSYLGYYGDEVHHPYPSSTTWHIPVDDHSVAYTRMSEHHVLQSSQWEISRASTPCPLDLSLKPPPTPSTPRTEDAIEVDDEEDRRIREETQRQLENRRYRRDSTEDDPLIVDDDVETPRSSSVQSHHSHITHQSHVSYERLHPRKESPQLQEMMEKTRLPEDTTHLSPYSSSDLTQKYHHLHSQKMLLGSPTQLQSMQTYHQQLLLTPQHHLQGIHAPMTPPSTPSPPQCPRRRTRDEDLTSPSGTSVNVTPRQTPSSSSSEKPTSRPKKKHARRLKFDEDTSSPVSGTVILGPDEAVVTGDIDPAFNIVEVTEEARAELAKIENRLGPYQCKLCRQLHDDAFQLAQHRCSRIAHVEYRCPECDKRFSCPANLASHRRWHKPRLPNGENSNSTSTNNEIPCTRCDAKFTRQAALRKHLASQHPETNNSTNNNNNVATDGQETMGKIEAMQIGATNSLTNEIP